MCNYSIDTDIRKKVTIYMVLGSVIITFFIGIIANHFFNKNIIPLEINMSTFLNLVLGMFGLPMSIFAVIYYLYNNFIWKWAILYKLHKVPDFNGTWIGQFESTKVDEDGNNYTGPCRLVINQTWSKISIVAHFNQSTSNNHTADIEVDGNDGILLKFQYYNEADNSVNPNMMKHTGHNTLRYIPEENKLVGEYHTDRNRKTQGIMNLIKQ